MKTRTLAAAAIPASSSSELDWMCGCGIVGSALRGARFLLRRSRPERGYRERPAAQLLRGSGRRPPLLGTRGECRVGARSVPPRCNQFHRRATFTAMRSEIERAVLLLQRGDDQALEQALALLQNTVFSFSMKACGH